MLASNDTPGGSHDVTLRSDHHQGRLLLLWTCIIRAAASHHHEIIIDKARTDNAITDRDCCATKVCRAVSSEDRASFVGN